MTSLWDALGCPPRAAPLPLARSTAWRTARKSLHRALLQAGCTRCPWAPTGLWALLHGGRPVAGRTWGELCAAASVRGVAERLARSPTEACVTSWNARWLRDSSSDLGRAKRALIEQWLLAGRVVMLQESHWDTVTAELWRASCAAGHVFYSNAADGGRRVLAELWRGYDCSSWVGRPWHPSGPHRRALLGRGGWPAGRHSARTVPERVRPP